MQDLLKRAKELRVANDNNKFIYFSDLGHSDSDIIGFATLEEEFMLQPEETLEELRCRVQSIKYSRPVVTVQSIYK